jgi:hypothetical protein
MTMLPNRNCVKFAIQKNAEDFSSASGQAILPDGGLRLANAGI